ncbi:hypothetical protein B0J18DRAFT_283105 [Chaetomium sp. MPI-SDFR-AT-0129]|nr:hypothetical protein B0J18DRAFT_283105 [Chaetomium sp. MPI-SDFR-AT-0129]
MSSGVGGVAMSCARPAWFNLTAPGLDLTMVVVQLVTISSSSAFPIHRETTRDNLKMVGEVVFQKGYTRRRSGPSPRAVSLPLLFRRPSRARVVGIAGYSRLPLASSHLIPANLPSFIILRPALTVLSKTLKPRNYLNITCRNGLPSGIQSPLGEDHIAGHNCT